MLTTMDQLTLKMNIHSSNHSHYKSPNKKIVNIPQAVPVTILRMASKIA
jgi:hypothetical protein